MKKLNKYGHIIISITFICFMLLNFVVNSVYSAKCEYSGFTLECDNPSQCCGNVSEGFKVIKKFEDCDFGIAPGWPNADELATLACIYCPKVEAVLKSFGCDYSTASLDLPFDQSACNVKVRGTYYPPGYIGVEPAKIVCEILEFTYDEPFCCPSGEMCSADHTHCVGETIVNDFVEFEVTEANLDRNSGMFYIYADLKAKEGEKIYEPMKVIVRKLEYLYPSDKHRFIRLNSATEGDGTKGSIQAIDVYPPFHYILTGGLTQVSVGVMFEIELSRIAPFEFYVDVTGINIFE